MPDYAEERTRIGDDPDELTAACADVVELIYRPAPGRGPALTAETAPDLATALAGLLDCCADAHDDETHENYGGPHDPDASCMVCVARAALERHKSTPAPDYRGALEGLLSALRAAGLKLNVRQHFSLLNAEAYARKVIHDASEVKPG